MSIKKTLPSAITATALVLLQSSIAPSALADTETVGGIAWIYFVENGEATIGTGEWQAAIPTSTSGDIAIPSSLGGCPVRAIGYCALLGCDSITSVAIPASVTSIGGFAFNGCSGLTTVTIPDSVASIGTQAFDGCSGLTSLTIPDSVTSIGDSAFYGCSGLTSLTIPDSVMSIECSAFSGCSGLTSLTIPDSVATIWNDAFAYCSGLTSVTIPYAFKNVVSNWNLPETCEVIVRDKIPLAIATDATLPIALTSVS